MRTGIQVLAAHDAPEGPPPSGVHAAKQRRSARTHQALLRAGRELLKTHELPGLSVAQVAAAAGVAVGSFYARFEDKNAWFEALAREAAQSAVQDLQALLQRRALREAATAQQVGLLMRWLVKVHRDHQGIFRAAVSDPARTPLYWQPLMRLSDQVAAQVYSVLSPRGTQGGARLQRRRVAFAFQVVYGTLVNAVLHDPGPLHLHSPALAGELARVFLAAVGPLPPADS